MNAPLPAAMPLETPRLLLWPLTLEDAPVLQRIFPEWETVRYMSTRVPWPYPDDGALVFVRDVSLAGMARGEEWHWTLRLRSEPEVVIGLIGLLLPSEASADNRGFWICPPYRGQGLTTEACEVVTDFWFRVLERPVLRTSKAVPNRASSRISEKQGMRLVGIGEADYICGRLPQEVWEITREEWMSRRPSRPQE